MAEVVRYVNLSSSGGDGTTNGESGATAAYASLSAWEAAEQTDLVSAGDSHVVNCSHGSSASPKTDGAVTVSGWITGDGNGITINGERRGTKIDTSGPPYIYRIQNATGTCLFILNQGYVTVRGLWIVANGTGTNSGIVVSGTSGGFVADSCYVSKVGAFGVINTYCYQIAPNTTPSPVLRNCMARIENTGTTQPARLNAFRLTGTTAPIFVNCTIHYDDGGYPASIDNGAISANANLGRMENIIADIPSAGTVVYTDTGTPTVEDYNATNKATGFNGSNSRHSQTFTFADVANGDLALAANDGGAKGFGRNLQADVGFNDDILGAARASTWDIGAHQITVDTMGGSGQEPVQQFQHGSFPRPIPLVGV